MDLGLLKKYKNDQLTPEELEEMKNLIASLDDEELAILLDECDADTSGGDFGELPDDVVKRIKERCLVDAGIKKRHHAPVWLRPVLWAAAVLIPVLMASTIYLFMESNGYRQMASSDIAIITGAGERVTAVLPDSSRVELSYQSELRYAMSSFNAEKRTVRFAGEGFFTVSRNDAAPFVIDTQGLEVTVLGTQFNLRVRQDEELASLYLDEGSVDLRTCNQKVRMTPGQLASVNRTTGSIEVSQIASADEQTGWRLGYLCFNNRPIDNVLAALSSSYGYEITLGVDSSEVAGRFTGHIPADNFSEALSIIEYAYHLKARIDGRTVLLTK